MADLNLLQNQLKADSSIKIRKYLDYAQMLVFTLALLAGLAGTGLLVWNKVSVNRAAEDLKTIEQKKVDLEASISNKRDRVVTAQAQLYYASDLFANRLYWTKFLELINSATFTGVQFKQLSSSANGTASITGLVPDLPTLAVLTQKLNALPGVKRVILNSSALSNSFFQVFYTFTITVEFEPAILKYQEGQSL